MTHTRTDTRKSKICSVALSAPSVEVPPIASLPLLEDMSPKKQPATTPKEKKEEKKENKKQVPSEASSLEDTTAPESETDKSTGGRAAVGMGMEPNSVSGMLGALKYKADPKRKDPELRAAAGEALAIYRDLNATEKKKFLAEFEANGKGKKASNLKFALTFKRTLEVSESTEQQTVEGYFTKPQIAAFIGLSWSSYEPNTINAVVDTVLADNKMEYNHNMPDKPHERLRLLDLFWYVHSPGLTKSKKLRVVEETETAASDSRSALAAASGGVASSSEGDPRVKEENPGWARHCEKLKAVRSVLASVQKQYQVMSQLLVRLNVAARKDEPLRASAESFKQKCGVLSSFLDELMVMVAESEVREETDPSLSEEAHKLGEALGNAAAHLSASRESVKKVSSLLS